jgi:ParB/RepB/Spo0J family partition protein
MTIITERELYCLPLSSITDQNTGNIRTTYDDASIRELATSIKSKGLLSPLIVRQSEDANVFLLVAGHRRYRALQYLIKTGDFVEKQMITCFFEDGDEGAATVTMLVENLQREDIAVIDEARGYMRLVNEHSFKIKELAAAVGRSQAHINSRLALLTLGNDLLACVGNNVTIETALDLSKITDEAVRTDLSKKAVKGKLPSYAIQSQLRDEEKNRAKAKMIDWANKNLITLYDNRTDSPANNFDAYGVGNELTFDEFKAHKASANEVFCFNFMADRIIAYRKYTKAELAERAERKAQGLVLHEPVDAEPTPYTEWDARYCAHEDAVTLYIEQAAEAAVQLILEMPAKALNKIVLEQVASAVTSSRSPRLDSSHLCSVFNIEVVDTTPNQAMRNHLDANPDRALRYFVISSYRVQLLSPTLTEMLDVEFARLGLVDPGTFTEPEPWLDENGNWRTDDDEEENVDIEMVDAEEEAA